MESARSLDWLTTAEASKLLDCTVQHVRVLIKQERLVGCKKGRDWFVEKDSVMTIRSVPSNVTDEQPEPVGTEGLRPGTAQSYVNVATVPQRSPFRYPGGKSWLIPVARQWLASVQPKPHFLVEPFAGGGSIGLLAAFEDYADRVLLVELDPDVAPVWRVMLGNEAHQLQSMILGFNCTLDEVHRELALAPEDDVRKAFHTILRNRVSRGGILAPGAGILKKGEAGRGVASRWYAGTLASRIGCINERRERISFEEGDGMEVLERYADRSDVAHFIDPPYPVAGRRLYRHFDLDHERLFEVMSRLRGPFLATYDNNAQIQTMAERFGLEWKLIPMKSTHHERKYELVVSRDLRWMKEPQPSLLAEAP